MHKEMAEEWVEKKINKMIRFLEDLKKADEKERLIMIKQKDEEISKDDRS